MRRIHPVMPGLIRASINLGESTFSKGWIAGSSPAMTKWLMLAVPSRIPRHQAAIHRDDRAGQERGRGQAQAQRHMGDLLGIAVAAKRGPAPGIDGLVLVTDLRRHTGRD